MKTVILLLLLSLLVYTAAGADVYSDVTVNQISIDGTQQMLTASAGTIDHSTMTVGSVLTVKFSGTIDQDAGMTRSIKFLMSGTVVADSGDITFDPSTFTSGFFPAGLYKYECELKFKVRSIDSGASTITYALNYGSFLHTKADSLLTNVFAFDTITTTIDSTLTSMYPAIKMDAVAGGGTVLVTNKMFDVDK